MHTALVGLLGLGLALLACKSKDESPPVPAAQPVEAPQAAAPAAPQIPTISRFQVGEGEASNGVWTPGFAALRSGGDQSKNYVEAAQSCESQGMALCSETQYIKACAANPAVAGFSSWTATWSSGTSVVTRGGGSCDTRAETTPSERSDSRMALCCERAIGIRTGNKNSAFMKASHADLLSFEKDFNGKSASVLSKHWADSVRFDGAVLSKAKVDSSQSSWFSGHPVQWTLYDVCDLKIGEVWLPTGKDKGLVADCKTVTAVANRDVSVFTTHFGRFRAEGDTRNRIVEIAHNSRIRQLSAL